MTTTDHRLAQRFQGCMATAARRLDRAIKSAYDEALRPTGLKSTQVTLMVYIAALDRPRAADLSAPMGIDQTTLSRNIDRLITLGHVDADPEDDARTKRLSLTNPGRRALKQALPLWEQAQTETQALLGPSLMNALTKAASRV